MIYIGIDPSINSTGICIRKDNEYEKFFIVKPMEQQRKVTKKKKNLINEINALANFKYVYYDKTNLKQYKDNYQLEEHYKTQSLMKLADVIYKTILSEISSFIYKNDESEDIKIAIEGISYGSSMRTKSVFDLAGLNYLIREKMLSLGELYILSPSQVKKFATGKGNADKELMLSSFKIQYEELCILPKIDDICDAWWMSQYIM